MVISGNSQEIICIGIPGVKNQNYMITATLTPGKFRLNGVFLENSNRVTREYPTDRFMRVHFNEAPPNVFFTLRISHFFQEVIQSLKQGLLIAGRRYDFLCFSASQLREQKCLFFASEGKNFQLEKKKVLL